MRFTAPYKMPGGDWGAMALGIIADGFKEEADAWYWIAYKLSAYIDRKGA